MSNGSANEVATLVVRHRIKEGSLKAYEQWLRATIQTAKTYEGHLGIDVSPSECGGLPLYTSVLRFSCTEKLQKWLESNDRRQQIAKVQDMLADGDHTEVNQDREFWFNPTMGQSPPPRWKQACVTFIVILPHTLLVPLIWQPVFTRVPWLQGYIMSTVAVTVTIVLSVVYLFMPRVTRLFEPWLNARPTEKKP
ncbi:antibiotic biosynthesis monooxygenase [Pseudomonas sp. RIT-To-2]|uniref:antibiotic biosynthesis monooxygenase n=1 Tax=Pseudomonas sp. RIT-To-2 TaxID=3462541 RepID=UPI0024130985